MADRTAKIDVPGGDLFVSVHIGYGARGKYRIAIYGEDRDLQEEIADGLIQSEDGPDEYELGTAEDMIGKFVYWEIGVSDPAPTTGDLYSVTLAITQDGSVVEDGVFHKQDLLDGPQAFVDFKKLIEKD